MTHFCTHTYLTETIQVLELWSGYKILTIDTTFDENEKQTPRDRIWKWPRGQAEWVTKKG